MADYHLDYAAFGELVLNAPWMVEHMAARAEQGAEFARSIAPVDEQGRHPGRYRDSIRHTSGSHGGIHHDRAEGVVTTDAPEAVYVEFGTERAAAQHVMARTLDAL